MPTVLEMKPRYSPEPKVAVENVNTNFNNRSRIYVLFPEGLRSWSIIQHLRSYFGWLEVAPGCWGRTERARMATRPTRYLKGDPCSGQIVMLGDSLGYCTGD